MLTQKGHRYLSLANSSSFNSMIVQKWLIFETQTRNSETTVALDERGAISLWVGLSLYRIGKRTDRACRRWHALGTKMNSKYTYPNIAVSETCFLGVLVQR